MATSMQHRSDRVTLPHTGPRCGYRALATTATGCNVNSVNAEHIVVREPTDVMLVRVADQLSEIQRAWASFEAAVGLRGRKFYGAFDPVTASYSVCAVLRPGDDPSDFGAERGDAPRRALRMCASPRRASRCLREDRADCGAPRTAG